MVGDIRWVKSRLMVAGKEKWMEKFSRKMNMDLG